MEYADGGELFDHIVKNKRLQQKDAAKYLSQIIDGIQYIHKIGVVHRDLKPQNLLLDSIGKLKIVDFGLSNHYKQGQLLKTPCGSPCYAAPQMIAGKKYECINVDIWSSGVIMYAMICGYLPFQDNNTSKLYKKIIAGQFQMPVFLSDQGKKLLKNVLNTNPNQRFKINDIRKSKWMMSNVVYKSNEKGIIVGKDKIHVDYQVLRQMQNYGFIEKQVEDLINRNRHNHITTTYFLILKKHSKTNLQKQIKSNREIHQNQYNKGIMRNKKIEQQRNQSINASYIVSALTQANKNNKKSIVSKYQYKQSDLNNYFQKYKEFPREDNIKKKLNCNDIQNGYMDNLRYDQRNKRQKQIFMKDQRHIRTISNAFDQKNFKQNKEKNGIELSFNLKTEKQQQLYKNNKTMNYNFKKQQIVNAKPNNNYNHNQRPSFDFWDNLKQNNRQLFHQKNFILNTQRNNNITQIKNDNFYNVKPLSNNYRGKLMQNTMVPYYGPYNINCVFKDYLQNLMQKIEIFFSLKKLKCQWILSKFILEIENQNIKGQVIINSLQNIKGIYLIRFKVQICDLAERLIQEFLNSL